ncbi:transmembrane domain-containing protein [Cryptosporidium canis]|uniref:Transmembrane domain-containing protein n=1 Tax=Cryptosporidium canis TaxID=195482 RepID=A0ABQ8PAZ7_9CRYT|nr:transmembrane domain-containing protein [Cryptosporidium canis]
MENLETVWCSSSYIRPENLDLESERRSITTESILETEYRIVSAEDLSGVPLSGNEKVFAEQHLWSIQLDSSQSSKFTDFQEDTIRTSHLGTEVQDDNTVFFNNWGRIGRIILFIYITFLSILYDITGIVIPNSVYKSELSGQELNVVTETPSIAPIYPYYWRYVLDPARYVISLVFYLIWGVELTPKREFEGREEDPRERLVKEEGMTWIPRTLNIVHPIHYLNSSRPEINIYSKPSESTIRTSKGLRTCTRRQRIICSLPQSLEESSRRIRLVAIRPIGNVIAIGHSNSVSIWEYRPSILGNGGSGASQVSSINGGVRSLSESLTLNGKWNLIYSVDLFKLNAMSWSNDGSSLYIGDGSSIREFHYIYLTTQDSKKLGCHFNSEKFISNGHVVARGPTIANDCVSIAVSGVFSLVGTIWEGGYFRIYDTFTWESIQVSHKFGLRSKTFIPKVECVDNLLDKNSSGFIFADNQSIYEVLLINQGLSEIKRSKTVNISSSSESQVSNGIRLRELPIHSRNREKTILNFSTTFQRISVIYQESNMVWLYCYLMSVNTPSKLMLIGVIQDFGVPLQISMQPISESNHLVSGTLLAVKWQNPHPSQVKDSRVIQKTDSYLTTIKTYPLFHYLQ